MNERINKPNHQIPSCTVPLKTRFSTFLEGSEGGLVVGFAVSVDSPVAVGFSVVEVVEGSVVLGKTEELPTGRSTEDGDISATEVWLGKTDRSTEDGDISATEVLLGNIALTTEVATVMIVEEEDDNGP